MKGFFTREEIDKGARRHIEMGDARCLECGLYNKCLSPKMQMHGDGRTKCLLLAEAPGKVEDELGEQLVGPTGKFLKIVLQKRGYFLKKDFWRLNAVNCRPTTSDRKSNRRPTDIEIECCRPTVISTIKEINPKYIVCMGDVALQSLLGHEIEIGTIGQWRGTIIPDQKLKTWILPIYHPSFPNRQPKNKNLKEFYTFDIERILAHIQKDEPVPTIPDGKDKVDILTDCDQIVSALEKINSEYDFTVIDYETTGLKPYIPGHRIVTAAYSMDERVIAFPYEYGSFFSHKQRLRIKRGMRKIWKNELIRKVAHNAKFEHMWTTEILHVYPVNWYWCTLQGAHILDNRQKWGGLKFQTYINFGHRTWADKVERYIEGSPFNNIDNCPLNELLFYNGLDVYWTHKLQRLQECLYRRNENKNQKKAFDFFKLGSIILADVQSNGINVDEEYCHEEQKRIRKRIEVIERKLQSSEEVKLFREYEGKSLNIREKDYSDTDLRILFYKVLGYKPTRQTQKSKAGSVDEATLASFNNPFADLILKRRKLRKIESTYLGQFIRETHNGKMHPFFDLIVPVSYRGSSKDPNFQNIPKRDEQAKKSTRRAIRPTKGRRLLESDFSGIEVCINACYNHDPKLIQYLTDEKSDMHRDAAVDVWNIPLKEVHKDIRFYLKNQWVFPQFYGSYYEQCAKNLWGTMLKKKLKTNSGILLEDHVRSKGIINLELFTEHCKTAEEELWKRFQVYAQWKKYIQKVYQDNGFIETYFGFRFNNYMGFNECTNYPAQGTAFHCLLWTLMHVHLEIREKKMDSKIIGQIHDSMITDAVPDEVSELIKIIDYWGTKRLPQKHDWIIVPLKIDHELTDIDGSWYEKKEVK